MITRILIPCLLTLLFLLGAPLAAAPEPKAQTPPDEVLEQMAAFIRDTSKVHLYKSFAKYVPRPEGTKDPNRMQRATIRALVQFGERAVPYLIEFMTMPNHYNGPIAQQALGGLRQTAIPALIEVLKEDDGPRIEAAINALTSQSYEAVEGLAGLTTDEVPKVRARAADALHRIFRRWQRYLRPEQRSASADALTLMLDDKDAAARLAAIEALAALGGKLDAATPKLIVMLGSKDDGVAWGAACALAAMDETAGPALVAALSSDAPNARRYAAHALAKIGKPVEGALPALIARLMDDHAAVRRNAADALGRFGDDTAVKPLIAELEDAELAVQAEAADALAAFDDNAEAAAALTAWNAARAKTPATKEHVIPKHQYGGLYPGKVPGYPGTDGTQWIDYDNKGGDRAMWGYPEVLPYPGSVEHVRQNYIKYFPVKSRWDGASLVKKWTAPEIPGPGKAEQYAAPVYFNPMYGSAKRTEETCPPVAVQRWRVGEPITLNIGKLEPSYYIVRVIAAIETEHVKRIPEQLIMRFQVNDGLKGETRAFTRRFRCVDEFYSMAEWYFRAWDDRDFTVTLSLVEGTEVELLVQTIDLHDHLTYVARRAAKKEPTLHPLDRRAADRAVARADKRFREPSNTQLTPEEQMRWDAAAWADMPDMNTQFLNGWGSMSTPPADEVAEALARGEKDKGWGIYLPKSHLYYAPKAAANDRARNTFINLVYPTSGNDTLWRDIEAYYKRDDRVAARRAAFRLVRMAQVYPTWSHRQSLVHQVADPRLTFGMESALRKRALAHYGAPYNVKAAHAYDYLFDFIDGNEELATAVSRFMPDVNTSADVKRLIETNIVQYLAWLVEDLWMKSDHGTPEMMLTLATTQVEPSITKRWMEYLFSRTHDYPMPPAGLQDYLNTGTTRDGTTWIGSWFYTASGGTGIENASLIDRYIEVGGDPDYRLSDFRQYPKLLSSCQWALEGRVAGTYAMQIGDVNGPTVDYIHWFNVHEPGVRQGWEWTRDPRFAYFIYFAYGRKGQTDDEWKAIEDAAKSLKRHPWMANRSRVLSTWAGVLESGEEHEDFRFRRAATVRVGMGHGHGHNDTMDLTLFAHGCAMAPDGGQRPAYGIPGCFMTCLHNVVEVDGDGGVRGPGNWHGHSWVRTLADAPGSGFLTAESTPPAGHENVNLFRRHVALVDVDEGKPSPTPITPEMIKPNAVLPADIVAPRSYVFDVFRVSGGRRHTYCFHGGQNDGFEHNFGDVTPFIRMSPPDLNYVRKFTVAEDHKFAADAPETVQATWRLSRVPLTFKFDLANYKKQLGGYGRRLNEDTYVSPPAEPANLLKNYDALSPRKFTRLTLLGAKGARVLGAMYASPISKNHFDCLFVQRDAKGDDPLESAFVALIDPYAGEPTVASATLLDIPDNETDALRAVAAEVKTINGHTDLCFSDGRPDKVRSIGDMKLSGEYALVSRDANGLRQATLAGGPTLETGDVSIALPKAIEATVTDIDYLAGTITLDRDLPRALPEGTAIEIGNDAHRTSLTVSGEGRTLTYKKGVELVTTRVQSVDEKEGVVTCSLGIPPAGSAIRGLDKGLTATNGDRSQRYRCEYIGGGNQQGFKYKLTGGPVTEEIFPELGTLRVFEIGVGDVVRLTPFASVRRAAGGAYELTTNSTPTVTLKNGAKLATQ